MATTKTPKVSVPEHLQPYLLDMAALNGETVCQGHADVCAIVGHGKNLRNGIEQGTCPRCGVVTAEAPRSAHIIYRIGKGKARMILTQRVGATTTDKRAANIVAFETGTDWERIHIIAVHYL